MPTNRSCRGCAPLAWLVLAVVCMAVLLSRPLPSSAQSTLGTIRGTLYDTQGQPVPGASLRVVDESTGLLRKTATDSRGSYEVPSLRAGSYRVEDDSPGLVAFGRSGVQLRAGETLRIDLVLTTMMPQVVAGQDPNAAMLAPPVEIVVSAEGEANIQLESPAIQGGLDAQQLSSLPRNSREFQDFLYLNPNVLGHFESGFHFLGARHYGITYVQDGQPSNGVLAGQPTNSSPALEAIDEVKVLSNSYSAEFGGLAGLIVTTRRGGNRLSATAFYDFNTDELNALTYDQKASHVPRDFEGRNTRAHRYGLGLGGPIKKEKTFFLVNYEGFRNNEFAGGLTATVPSELMRRGDFSEASFVIRDPRSGAEFPGNAIPPARLDPAAIRILDFFYPLPNLDPLENGLGRYREFVNLQGSRHRVDTRIDHEISQNDSAFVRFTWQHTEPGTTFENARFPRLGVLDRTQKIFVLATSWTHIFSSNLLNELRAGFNLQRGNRHSRYVAGQVADRLGIEIPARARNRQGYPGLIFGGQNAILTLVDGGEGNRDTRQASYSVSDTVTWLRGRHSLRLGGLYSRDTGLDSAPLATGAAAGRFNFDGRLTGNALADFLLGSPARTIEGVNNRGLEPLNVYSDLFAAFVQDDWKLSNRLTLFLGLRYEVATAFKERNDLIVSFDPESGRTVLPSRSTASLLAPNLAALPSVLARELGLGRALVRTDANNVSPRAGFAYRLDRENRSVLRGGAGLFYPTAAATAIRDTLSRSPFNYAVNRSGMTLGRGFSTTAPQIETLPSPSYVDPEVETPEIWQYHLSSERELPGHFGLRLSYLGSRMRKLAVNRSINTLRPSTIPFDRRRLPFPNLGTSTYVVESRGSGRFDALQLEARRRFHGGLGLSAAYTRSWSETNAPGWGNASLGIVLYDPFDIDRNLGPDPYVVNHRLVMDGVWDVPVGRRRRFLSKLPGWADTLLGGWTLATIVQARSGLHMTPFFTGRAGNAANTGLAPRNNNFLDSWRPDVVGDPHGTRDRNAFFNLGAFRLPAAGTLGNAGAGILEGPGTWVVNLGIYKSLYSSKRLDVQVRATLDNAFNHPQFFVDPIASDFLDLSDYLLDGIDDNGTANRLLAVDSLESFSPGRVVRVGLYLRF